MHSFKIYGIWPQASKKETSIHTHFRNAVTLVWGSLRLAPIKAKRLLETSYFLLQCILSVFMFSHSLLVVSAFNRKPHTLNGTCMVHPRGIPRRYPLCSPMVKPGPDQTGSTPEVVNYQATTHLLPLALVLVLHTHNNTDGNKLVIF